MTLLARLNPLIAPVLCRVQRGRGPEAQVIQPAETEAVRPPAMLPGMLDRVTGTDEHSVLAFHLEAVTQTQVTHAPVLRWTYRNALVRRSGFATAWHQERYGKSRNLAELAGPIAQVATLRYCYNYVIWRYFGHWLSDAIPSSLIDSAQGELWMPPQAGSTHAADYLRALDLSVVAAPVVQADELIVYQDFGQGSHQRARNRIIRDRLHARFGGSEANHCLYIRRGTTGAPRSIVNETALLDELHRRNWQIVDVATASTAQLQRAVCRARVVVSMEGSHINHAHTVLRTGAVLVVLTPQDRFGSNQLGFSRAGGVTPGIVVLSGSQAQGYVVNVDEVLRTVDLAEGSASGFSKVQ